MYKTYIETRGKDVYLPSDLSVQTGTLHGNRHLGNTVDVPKYNVIQVNWCTGYHQLCVSSYPRNEQRVSQSYLTHLPPPCGLIIQDRRHNAKRVICLCFLQHASK